MAVQVTEYVDVRERATALGCRGPTNLALLPRNFHTAKAKEELLHESTTATVRKLWRDAGLVEERIEAEGEAFPHVADKALDWLGPAVFVGAALASENPHLVQIAIGVITNYVSDLFKGIPSGGCVRLDIIVEQRGRTGYKRIRYEGRPEGLSEISQIIRSVASDED